MRLATALIAAALLAGTAFGEEVATTSAPATSTAPADSVREKLFGSGNKETAVPVPAAQTKTTNEEVPKLGAVEAVGGGTPMTKSVPEGTFLVKRVVRMSRDEKTGNYLIAFESDGKVMGDPPMIAVPSKSLAAMEDLQSKSAQPIRFQITGEVTEYKGKNYILIQTVLEVRELNSGIGGG